ncbi:MAG: hypothetical protein RIT44_88 [Pseudomonadota bacterium]
MAHAPSNSVTTIVRCPACSSTYSVVPDQIKIAQGWLRCGQCQHAFDSTGLLVAWPKTTEPDASLTSAPDSSGRLVLDELLKQEDRSPSPVPAAEIVSSFEQALATFKPQALPSTVVPEASSEDKDSEWGEEGQEDGREDEQKDGHEAESPPSQPRWWVTAGACLLLLALALQWMWIERRALAATVPYADAIWRETCRTWGCDVSAPQVKNAIVIENSSLTPTEGGGTWLTWTWRNTASHAVQVPALDLTLLNAQDQAVLRRVISAAEMEAPASLSAAQVWSGKLHLVPVSGPTPTGYRLLSFYP